METRPVGGDWAAGVFAAADDGRCGIRGWGCGGGAADSA